MALRLGKMEGKRREGPAASWMDSVTVAMMNAPLGDLKLQFRNKWSWGQSINVNARSKKQLDYTQSNTEKYISYKKSSFGVPNNS